MASKKFVRKAWRFFRGECYARISSSNSSIAVERISATPLLIQSRDAGPGDLDQVLGAEVLEEAIEPVGRAGNLDDMDIMRLAVENFELVFLLQLLEVLACPVRT